MRSLIKKPDGQHVSANTNEDLIEKLYDYYLEKCLLILKDQDYWLCEVYKCALKNYAATRNPSENTVYKYTCNYTCFFKTRCFRKSTLETSWNLACRNSPRKWWQKTYKKENIFRLHECTKLNLQLSLPPQDYSRKPDWLSWSASVF